MFPRRSDETGVPADVAARVFPKIPNVEHPDNSNRLFFQNHGPEFDAGSVEALSVSAAGGPARWQGVR